MLFRCSQTQLCSTWTLILSLIDISTKRSWTAFPPWKAYTSPQWWALEWHSIRLVHWNHLDKAWKRSQVVLSEQHKTHKHWQIKPIVNMQLWHWWWTYWWWLKKNSCQKISTKKRHVGGSKVVLWIVSPCAIHCLNALIQWILAVTLCRCLDQYSYWSHSSHKCQHRRFSHSWPWATLNIWVFIAWRLWKLETMLSLTRKQYMPE